ncbi:MAG: hypothetical protein [Podoviridae sp. ctQNx1]|nr:MAG: hypothetical protein [Podoviridae sp. ctQNx1]UOF78154.1 hypothetical protein [Caudoviricetes sp.]
MKLPEGHRQDGRWIFAPMDDITTPKNGRTCCCNRWWAVTENNEVMFFHGYHAPQCNERKDLAERLVHSHNEPPAKTVFIEVAYIPHECSDYV